jgi:hypothetical protein
MADESAKGKGRRILRRCRGKASFLDWCGFFRGWSGAVAVEMTSRQEMSPSVVELGVVRLMESGHWKPEVGCACMLLGRARVTEDRDIVGVESTNEEGTA